MKKLIPAIVMLLVSAVVLSTASYAWFTTSQDVTASGMKVTAEAPTSILIRGITNAAGDWSAFSSGLTFADMGHTNVAASSSKNGVEFFEPDKCSDATGAIEPGSAILDSDNYVDYQIELKNDAASDNAEGGSDQVKLRVEEIVAGSSALANAVRVAIIVGTPQDEASTAAVAVGTKDDQTGMYSNVFVYTQTSYQGQEKWVMVGTDTDSDSNYEYDTEATGPLADKNTVAGVENKYSVSGTGEDATSIVTLEGQQYVRITIRVWFEGQDATCISENAGLSATVNVTFGIVGRTIETTPEEGN